MRCEFPRFIEARSDLSSVRPPSVGLQLQSLCQQRSDEDIMREPLCLRRGLDKTFARLLLQINEQPQTLRKLARKCLMWAFYARRPPSMVELRFAAAIEWPLQNERPAIYKAELILESCANLLIEENECVRPIHSSVREFFTNVSDNGVGHTDKELFLEASQIEAEVAI